MARQRRRVVSESTPPSHNLLRQRSKSYQLRSSPIAPKDHSVPPHYSSIFQDRDTQRQVLVPLQQNLRRLPSRRNISMPVPILPNLEYHGLGRKRKRVASGIENRNAMPRHRTPSGRPSAKRTRSTRGDSDADEEEGDRYTEIDEDEENDDVAMEVDFESDVYFLQTAPQWRLAQLQKKELCRLLRSLSPRRSTEELTKQDLINALLSFRQRGNGPPPSPETPYPPPSSPPLTATSEDESQLKLEKYNRPMIGLRRRATTDNQAFQSPVKQRLPSLRTKDRSFSMSHLGASGKRASSGSSSEELVTPCTPPQTPAARTRKASQTQGGKKQVEFTSPPSLSHSESSSSSSNKVANPSPRRLRSRQKDAPTVEQSSEGRDGRTRRVKGGVNSSETPQSSEDEGEDEGEQSQDDEESQRSERLRTLRPRKQRRESESSLTELMPEDDEEQEEDIEESDGEEEQSEEEEEEQEPPLRKRLRPLPGRIEEDDAHDADKEESADEEDEEEETVDDSAEEEVEEIIAPKILRNGKVVGVDDPDEEEEGEDEDEVMQTADEAEEEVDELDEEVDEVLEDDDVDESSDLDVDLSSATQKSLTRLNRPVLVQLCDSRELESDGLTKAQLAKTLIKWRDAAAKQDSTQTVKQGSTTSQHRGRRKSASTTPTTPATPLLLRSAASTVIHESDPSTPTPGMEVLQSSGGLRLQHQENEPELELDLESLGLEDREIPPDKLEKKEKIGSGGFKDVFVGKLRGRVKVAIAEFRSQLTPMDIKELKLLSDFDHPNVVRFLGVSIPENSKETGTPVMIVSELCTNGDLFDYIRNVSAPTLHKVIGLMLDIARGIEYLHLHKPSIIHRDAKSSNILITAKVTAKITDFGLAKVKQSTRSMVRSLVGTVNWQAPELWSPTPKYGHKVDVFSCACVFWEMMQWKSAVKKFPWEGMNEHAIYDLVGAKRQRPSVAGLKKTWCPEIVELTERMWAHDPADRPTMSEVVEELKRLHAEY